MRVGLEIAALLKKKYAEQFDVTKTLLLLGNEKTVEELKAGVAPEKIIAGWSAELAAFDAVRQKYFLYK
jgi:uncharacterized protein YbbC (DUF1343 family)